MKLNRGETRELYHNKGLVVEELISHYGKSERLSVNNTKKK